MRFVRFVCLLQFLILSPSLVGIGEPYQYIPKIYISKLLLYKTVIKYSTNIKRANEKRKRFKFLRHFYKKIKRV